MADESKKKVVLELDLNIDPFIKEAQEAQKEVERLSATQKELAKTTGTTTAEYQENAAKLREQKTILREANKAIDDRLRVERAEEGSLKQLRAQLSVATAEYVKLKEANRDNTEEGKKLQAGIKATSDRLKELEGAVGDNRRNVGDYAGALRGVLGEFNLMPGALGNVSKAVGGVNTAFKLLLTNPIILVITGIVAALAALYKAFTSTDEGGTQMAAIFKSISAVVEVVTQRVAALASALVSFFKGDFSEAANKFGEAFTGIADQITAAAKAAYEYTYALDALQDSQDAYISQTAKMRNEIARLKADAEDQSKSVEERKAALEQSLKLQEQETKKQREFANERYQIELANKAATLGIAKEKLQALIEADDEGQKKLLANDSKLAAARNQLNNEGQVELENLYANYINLDTEYFEKAKESITKVGGFTKQIDAERKKSAEDAAKARADSLKKEAEEAKAAVELQLGKVREGSAEELQLRTQLLAKQRDLELLNKELTESQKLLIAQKYDQQAEQLGKDFLKKRIEDTKKALDDTLKSIDDAGAYEAAQFAKTQTAKFAALEESRAKGIISEEEYQIQLEQLQFEAGEKQKRLAIDIIDDKLLRLKAGSDEAVKLEAERAAIEVDINKSAEDRKRAENKKTADLKEAQQAADISNTKAFAGTLKKLFKEGSEGYKAFALLEAAADTASAAIAAYKSTAAIPVVGPALAPIAAGAAVAYGVLQQSNIRSLEDGGVIYPKAARGIILGGNSHADGGTKFVGSDGTRFEAEKGELLAVVNKRSTGLLRNLSDLNQAGGGVNFFQKGGLSYLADGGFAARNATEPVLAEQQTREQIRDIVVNMPRPVVLVQDINTGQENLITVEDRAVI